jgi:hypothetical protein
MAVRHYFKRCPGQVLQRLLRLKLDLNFAGLRSDVVKTDQARYGRRRELAVTNGSHSLEYGQSIGLISYFSRIVPFNDAVSCG